MKAQRIKKLKNEIDEYEKHSETIHNEMKIVDQLIGQQNYLDAKSKAEELLSDKTFIVKSQEDEINNKITIINNELEKIEKERAEKEKTANEVIKKKEEIQQFEMSREEAINIVLKSDVIEPNFIQVLKQDNNYNTNIDGVKYHAIELLYGPDSYLYLVNSQNGNVTRGDYFNYSH